MSALRLRGGRQRVKAPRWGYTVPELAALVGVHRVTMWRLLKKNGLIEPGRRRIPIHAIRAKWPDMWASFQMARDMGEPLGDVA